MIPENPEIYHGHMDGIDYTDPLNPRYKCSKYCIKCKIDARDKEWAKWFMERFNKISEGQAVTTVFSKADYEALKKLAE
jgi:hypothetical protein